MPKLGEETDSSFVGKLKAFYYKLEDKYYAFLDSLHEKGVDLYKYFVEPIENMGVPSFPVAIALTLVILGGIIYGASILATPTGTLNISLSTASGTVDGIPVTLVLDGNDFATKSTFNGISSFENVPLNRRAQVRVNHPSFQPVLRDVSLTGEATSLEILLESKTPETRDFIVTVLDQLTGAPIRDASISFQSLSTGLAGTVATQPDGTAVIALDPSDSIISLSINAENFEAVQRSVLVNESQLIVQLISTDSSFQDGGDQPVRGTVTVSVKDALGNFLSANVQIFAGDSSEPLASDNVESGVARFENVAPVGTSVYAVVQPISEAYLSTQTTSQEISPDEELEFIVQLENATNTNSQTVSITVVSDVSAAIEGANVLLFSANTNQLITRGTSDNSGRVSFTLASTISLENIYVAVNAENYLPNIVTISSRDSTVELSPLAAGNNVEFDAEVLDADNQPASDATIELRDASGRLYGITQVAGPNGKATFLQVPVDVSLRLFALLDGATGQSDVFQVAFAENGQRTISFNLERPVGTIVVTALDLIDSSPVNAAFVTAFMDSTAGQAVANCTTDATGTCSLEDTWANKDLFIVTSATGFESSTSSAQFVSPGQTKHIDLYILNEQFKTQTIINLVSLLDDKGHEVINFPTIEKGRVYTARFAASFANGSQTQGVFVRLGDQSTTASDATVIKRFEFSPATLGTPLAVHSTTYLPGSDCSRDLLNNDVNNQGKKWVEVHYNGVSGVVELALQVFVKPTADASSDKLSFHYRAFAVQSGKYSRNPYDNELGLNRRSQAKDECYADTIDKEISLIEGSSVCNEQGTSCVSVSFNSPEQPTLVSSPFIATINRPFNLNFEIRNFGPVEGSSAYARIISTTGLVKFNSYNGQGTSSIDDSHTSVRTLFAQSQDVYNGSVSATGVIPIDFASFKVEFGDARGVIASNSRSFAVVQGTGTLTLSQLTPTDFEVGKSKDLRLTVKTSAGQPINDATIAFEEENGSPFNGDVPAQVAGDNTPGNGLDGQYVIRRIRPVSSGTFSITVSRDRFAPVSRDLTSNVASFFEFDQPDFISLSCNATTLRVRNTLDVAVTADVFVDPSCINVGGPGLTQVASQGGQDGTSHYRIPDFKPGRTRLLSIAPNSNQSCQLEISATDPRTGTRSLDDPIQIENTCTTFGATNATKADKIIYINGNVFQPPRAVVDTFSQMYYGSYQSPNLYDSRFPDAASYASAPLGGHNNFYQRVGALDQNGQPNSQFVDQRYAGMGGGVIPQSGQFPQQAVGVPREAAFSQYGLSGYADEYGGGSFFDISRQNFQRNWTISWINQDPVPHSFKCTDRSGNAIVQVDSIDPQQVYTQLISKPGMYYCKLENTNTGTLKIKSMCPKKGALHYTRLITQCMARKMLGDSGLFDGGKQHAAKVAAAVKTKFTAFAGRFNIEQTDKNAKVDCTGSEGGATCTVKITPLVPRNGFGFAIQDASGKPDYLIRLKPGGTIHDSCFTFDQLDKTSTYRALLDPIVSGVSALGLTSAPDVASFAIKFNEKDNCVKIRPDTSKNFRPYISNPQTENFLEGDGYAEFTLQSNANPNVKYTIKLIISPTQKPDEFLDGRFLFTTIPTTVGENKLFYRTDAAGDPREPGFVLNNLPEDKVGLLPSSEQGEPAVVQPNSIGVLSGNEVPANDKLASISQFKNGFYLCTEKGGCRPEGGQAKLLTPFVASHEDNAQLEKTAMVLGDVIGNYKFETAPKNVPDDDKPFVCSGVNYCSRATEAAAVDLAQKQVEEAFKKQYQYVETFNLDSTMDNMQDGLTDCIASALAEVAAQEAQYQMCKTLADFCGNPTYIDPEEEEIEEGESFAAGLTLDGVLGDSKGIITDIICQETEAGQNLQALRPCLQPGNRACRDMIAKRIVGNLRQAKVQSVAKEVPIVAIKDPVINFVTKRIQDDPRLTESEIGSTLALGGYNVYQFAADREKLIGEAGRQTREEGKVIFEVRPPGFSFSKAVVTASAGISGAVMLPFRLPEMVYDWATSTAQQQFDINKLKEIALGFPYVVKQNDQTRVEFDKFQPTLLTLNKYPVMRGVINTARETTDTKVNAEADDGKCTVRNRPVDPIGLFDDCEELRTDQPKYDKEKTASKAPFSRSLVFQAVPAGTGGDNLRPIWPAEFSSEVFQVAIPPEYEFTTSGRTTAGVSPPLVSYVPGLGRALYPLKDVPGQFETLEIKGDIKKYAVQVTSCKYTRQTDGTITMDAMENNCAAGQWPIGVLFPGSDESSLSMNINGQPIKCDAGQSCIAGQLIGSHLKVAVVGGLVSGTPSFNLKDASPNPISLSSVARDLMRYYVDESYTPTRLLEVLKENSNACELKANTVSFMLKCAGSTAEQTAQPVLVPTSTAEPASSTQTEYNLVFNFGDAVSRELQAKFNAAATDATALANLRNVLVDAEANSNTKITCIRGGVTVEENFPILSYGITESSGTITFTPVSPTTTPFTFDAPVTSCTATFEINTVAKLQSIATIAGDTITFDFTNGAVAPIANVGAPAAAVSASGQTCTASAKLLYASSTLSYSVIVSPPSGVTFSGTETYAVETVWSQTSPTSSSVNSLNFDLVNPPQDFVFSPQPVMFTIKNSNAIICSSTVMPPSLTPVGVLKTVNDAGIQRQGFQFDNQPPAFDKVVLFTSQTDLGEKPTRLSSTLSPTGKTGYYFEEKTLRVDQKLALLVKTNGEVTHRLDTGITSTASQAPAAGGGNCNFYQPTSFSYVVNRNQFRGLVAVAMHGSPGTNVELPINSKTYLNINGVPTPKTTISQAGIIGFPVPYTPLTPSTTNVEVVLEQPDGTQICKAPVDTNVAPCVATEVTLTQSGSTFKLGGSEVTANDAVYANQRVYTLSGSASPFTVTGLNAKPTDAYFLSSEIFVSNDKVRSVSCKLGGTATLSSIGNCQVSSSGPFLLKNRNDIALSFPVELTAVPTPQAGATVELLVDPATKIPYEHGKPIFFSSIAPDDGTSKNITIKNPNGSKFCQALLTSRQPVPSCEDIGGAGQLRQSGQSEVIIAGSTFTRTSSTNNLEGSYKLFVPGAQVKDIEFKPDTTSSGPNGIFTTQTGTGRWMVNGLTSRPAKSYLVKKYSSGNYAELICAYPAPQTAPAPEPQPASLTGTCTGSANAVYLAEASGPAVKVSISIQSGSPSLLPAGGTIMATELPGVYDIGSSSTLAGKSFVDVPTSQVLPSQLHVRVLNSDTREFCTLTIPLSSISQCTSQLVLSGINGAPVKIIGSGVTSGHSVFVPGDALDRYEIVQNGQNLIVDDLVLLPTKKSYLLNPPDNQGSRSIRCFFPPSSQTLPVPPSGTNLRGQCTAIAQPVYYPFIGALATRIKVSTSQSSPSLPENGKIVIPNYDLETLMPTMPTVLPYYSTFVQFDDFPQGSKIAVSVKKPDETDFCTLPPVTVSTISQCSTSLSELPNNRGIKINGAGAVNLVGRKVSNSLSTGLSTIIPSSGDVIIPVFPYNRNVFYLLGEPDLDGRSTPIQCQFPPLVPATPPAASQPPASPPATQSLSCIAVGKYLLSSADSTQLTLVVYMSLVGRAFPEGFIAFSSGLKESSPTLSRIQGQTTGTLYLDPSLLSTSEPLIATFTSDDNVVVCSKTVSITRPRCSFNYGQEGSFLGLFGGVPIVNSPNRDLNNMKLFSESKVYSLSKLRTGVWKVEGYPQWPLFGGLDRYFMQPVSSNLGDGYNLACFDP